MGGHGFSHGNDPLEGHRRRYPDCPLCLGRHGGRYSYGGFVESPNDRLNREIRSLRIRVAELELDAAKARLLSLRAGG